jgi:formylglycine-generating enzyme
MQAFRSATKSFAWLLLACSPIITWATDPNAPPILKAPFDEKAARVGCSQWAGFLKTGKLHENTIGMKLSLIPPGEFTMGSPESEKGWSEDHKLNEPAHQVRITQPFFMGIFPVTVKQFRQFAEAENYRTEAEKDPKGGWGIDGKMFQDPKFTWRRNQSDDEPVSTVTWNDATAFCKCLSKKEHKTYRLPTEAEWEYACRAGTVAPFNFGDSLNGDMANCNGKLSYDSEKGNHNSEDGTYRARLLAVGSFKPNAFGLFDMHGNISQWCSDWYEHDPRRNEVAINPIGPTTGERRVARGGSWYVGAVMCRSAERGGVEPNDANFDVGFRVVMEP